MGNEIPVVSYVVVAFRPFYASRLICEIVRKTSIPYELLIWLNVDDGHLDRYISHLIANGYPIRIVGKTPENIGMAALKNILVHTRGEIICQIDDDVICISRNAAEVAQEVFNKYPKVHMVGGHVWQDEFTTGCRPPIKAYTPVVEDEGLYMGTLGGTFTFYRRQDIALMLELKNINERYFCLGTCTHLRLLELGLKAWLSIKIMAFHVHGPIYNSYYGMLDFEINKFRSINYMDEVKAYEDAAKALPPNNVIGYKIKEIESLFESFDFRDVQKSMVILKAAEQRVPVVSRNPDSTFRIDSPGPRGVWHHAT